MGTNITGIGVANAIGFRLRGSVGDTPPKGLMASYRGYYTNNDSPNRNILKDLSGNGNDIKLYNFGYTLGSG